MITTTTKVISVAVLLALVGAILASAFVTSASAAPAGEINKRVEFRRIVPNRCTEEPVLVTGTAHIVGHMQINDGVASGHLHIDAHGTGESRSGQEYVLNATGNGQVRGRVENGRVHVALDVTGHLIAKGQADDLHVHGRVHMVVERDGDVSLRHFQVQGGCN